MSATRSGSRRDLPEFELRRIVDDAFVIYQNEKYTTMVGSFRKWWAVRSYAKRLSRDLKKRYGKQKWYTPAQVKRTAEQGGYNVDYLCYAQCIYCSPGDFADYHRVTGVSCDYSAMRSEVGDRFFSGDASFNASDVIEASTGAESMDFGGGFDGGDFGGGGNGGAD